MTGHWIIERADLTHPLVNGMVQGYLDELRTVVPKFDAATASPPDREDFTWPNGSFVLVFSTFGEPVACGGLRCLSDTRGELRRMWVVPAWRNQGLGRILLLALEEVARDLGLEELCLDTNEELVGALALYRNSGYREILQYNDNEFADYWLLKRL